MIASLCTLALCAGVDLSNITCTVHAVHQQGAEPREFAVPAKDIALDDGFSASSIFREIKGGQRTDIVVRDTTGSEREIMLAFRLSLDGDLDQVFTTNGKGPVKLTDNGHTRYRSSCSLPIVTFFGPKTGWTVAAPLEVPAPSLTFSWQRTGKRLTVTATVANLRLPAKGKAQAGLLVARHEGCWRPGLGWLVSVYPEFFRAPNPKVLDYDGPMIYDFVTPTARLRRDLEQDLKWQELGWYWPHLGLYLPPGETWSRQPRSAGGLGHGGPVSRRMLNEYIGQSNRLGVAQCLYFQSTESWADYAETNFPECRYRRADGALASTWIKCVVMNPDPAERFGQHILQQARGLVAAFPGMAGVFWDQNCYTGFDYAHDDGISMAGGRRVSMMEFAQMRILAQGAEFLHDHGKVIFTNGGWTAGLARYCDGHMSEGTGPTRRLQYICMLKHLTLLAYDRNLRQSREKILLALETGAQPSVTLGDDACRQFYRRYRPIFRLLRGKEWVFYPRALELPRGIGGNIFRNDDGNIVVTAVEDDPHKAPVAELARPVNVRIRLPDAAEVAAVFELNPKWRGLQAVATTEHADGFSISFPRPEAGTALLLARRGRWIGAGVPHLLAGRSGELSLRVANLTPERWSGPWRILFESGELNVQYDIPPHRAATIPLGKINVSTDKSTIPIRVFSPDSRTNQEATVIEVPVISSIEVQLPCREMVQIRLGGRIDYALANRAPKPVGVTVETRWTKGAKKTFSRRLLTLEPGEIRTLFAAANLPNAGDWKLAVTAVWPGGSKTQRIQVDLYDVNLPADFRIEAVNSMTLNLDIFNSLGGKWAVKPLSINGIEAGMLPITGQTLSWHKALAVNISGVQAKKMLTAGLRPNGDIELKTVVDNKVKNCFKVRNIQATIRAKSGEQFKTTRASRIKCSDGSWLYAEGTCVRNGQPVPLDTLRFIRKH